MVDHRHGGSCRQCSPVFWLALHCPRAPQPLDYHGCRCTGLPGKRWTSSLSRPAELRNTWKGGRWRRALERRCGTALWKRTARKRRGGTSLRPAGIPMIGAAFSLYALARLSTPSTYASVRVGESLLAPLPPSCAKEEPPARALLSARARSVLRPKGGQPLGACSNNFCA